VETPESKQRRAIRVAHSYMLRARCVNPPDPPSNWDIFTVRNISETGILFSSCRDYALGSKLEIRITLPFLQKNCTCWGTVVRCLPSKEVKNIYEVAVAISDIEEEAKKALYENIKFRMMKEGKKK